MPDTLGRNDKLSSFLLAGGALPADVALQDLTDAGLISGAAALEPSQHLGIEPYRHKLLGIIGFWTPAPNELVAMVDVGTLKKIVGQFRNLFIFVRLDDVTVNPLQVASRNLLFRGHLPSSLK